MCEDDKYIIYIGGFGRSGSTAIELALEKEFGFFSGGELINADRADYSSMPCSCGANITNCTFWSSFNKTVSSIEYIFTKSQTNIIIDSSKTTYKSLFRPLILA